jgi:rhodanese-related sulfurtransferase
MTNNSINHLFLKSFILILCLLPFYGAGQTKLTAEQLEELLTKDKTVQLIDVRTPGEFSQGYIKGSRLFDYSSADFIKKLNTLDKSMPVAVYCAVGGRSGKTAQKLKELGFKNIYDFPGGMTEWKAKQKPIVKP